MIRYLVLSVLLSVAPLAATASEHYDDRRHPLFSEEFEHRSQATRFAQSTFDEVVSWLCANFDLSRTTDRPSIEFASKAKLLRMRMADRAEWRGTSQEDSNPSMERSVVAVYDTISKTIFLSDEWTGQSVADQSILVHEMVHHLQNLAQQKFECPAAREKVAYLAQDKWLAKFGTSLEKEFQVDMFTVVISSACM